MNEKEITDEIKQHFDKLFTQWVEVHMPTPAVAYDALRASAYEWYMEGVRRGQSALATTARDHWQTLERLRTQSY